MRSYLITAFLAIICGPHLLAQSTKFQKNEARLVVENDAFTLNFYRDQYYTSGIFPSFRYLKDTSNSRKTIHSFQLNHRTFTPRDILWRSESLFDRPYAGQVSLSFINETYFRSGKYLKWSIEMGWMGPSSGVGNMHRYWHKILNMGVARGWAYQINDTPIALLNLGYGHSLLKKEKFEILSESFVTAGTTNNLIRQEISFRFGKFFTIDRSSYYAGQLGSVETTTSAPKMNEIYFFYAPSYEMVLYNASIEGNLIGEASLHTSIARRHILQHRYGFVMSWPSFDLGATGYIRTAETKESTGHYFVGIQINQRF